MHNARPDYVTSEEVKGFFHADFSCYTDSRWHAR